MSFRYIWRKRRRRRKRRRSGKSAKRRERYKGKKKECVRGRDDREKCKIREICEEGKGVKECIVSVRDKDCE